MTTLNPAADPAADTVDEDTRRHRRRGCRKDGWRAGAGRCWPPAELVTMILGFVIFWPIGLAIIGWKLNWFGLAERFGARSTRSFWRGNSGNWAFNEWRQATLDRLEDERTRLAEEEKAFGRYLERLRRARDREEFDRYMRKRDIKPGDAAV